LARLICFCYFSDNVISERTNAVYEFGPFRLELNEHRLVREGRTIPITGKAFDTLRVLVERHGMLVLKRDLMNAVWPETTVEENNLDRNISLVRTRRWEKKQRARNTSKLCLESDIVSWRSSPRRWPEALPIQPCQRLISPPSRCFRSRI